MSPPSPGKAHNYKFQPNINRKDLSARMQIERGRERENLKAWENSGSTVLQEVDAHYHIAVNRNLQ